MTLLRLGTIAAVAAIAVGGAGAGSAGTGWKTISVLNGHASLSIPATWPRDKTTPAWAEYWGYLDGRGNLAIAWFGFQKSFAAFKAFADHATRGGYGTEQSNGITSTVITIGGRKVLEYTITYRQKGFELRNWDYYLLRGGRGYEFSYDVWTNYADALKPIFDRSARSIRLH